MTPNQGALFDRLASGDSLYVYSRTALDAFNALVPDKGRVLDVGCGDGAVGEALDAVSVVAFDISSRCATLAGRRGLLALAADAAAPLPFDDVCFDTVYCADVLHHLPGRWEKALAEVHRVLRPGGMLAIVEPDARNPFVRWTQAPGSLIRVAPCDNEPAIYPEDLLLHLQRLGYEPRCRSIHIEGHQVERSVFPLWQRIAKAPIILALAWWYRSVPNKFAITARKPQE